MRSTKFQNLIFRLVSLSLLSLGMAQASSAAMIATQQVVQSAARDAGVARVEAFLARDEVASQLVEFGVDPLVVQSRVGSMTDAELLELEGKLDTQVAGGDGVIAVIGLVFVVLIILEFVGVTDIFKRM